MRRLGLPLRLRTHARRSCYTRPAHLRRIHHLAHGLNPLLRPIWTLQRQAFGAAAPRQMDFECDFDNDESVRTRCLWKRAPKLLTHNMPASREQVKAAAALFAEQAAGVDQAAVTVEVVTGGITNKLKKVSYGDDKLAVLVRLFGAEGMIDRDEEDPLFEAICAALGEPRYYGRFKNGRVEGWLDGCRPLNLDDMSDPKFSPNIAAKMARLHKFDGIPAQFKEKYSAPGMWSQLDAWYAEATEPRTAETINKNPINATALASLNLVQAKTELEALRAAIPANVPVGFCHNDLLCGNIMVNEGTGAITLIDFEYGGTNFRGFDIANHFNEWAGGTDDAPDGSYPGYKPGVSDYSRFPSAQQQRVFCEAYLTELEGGATPSEGAVVALLEESGQFVLVNHWYWGLWAVNQARDEGCDEFPYLTYAKSRIDEYYKKKAELGAAAM